MVSNPNASWLTCSWYLLILALICFAFWKRAANWNCYISISKLRMASFLKRVSHFWYQSLNIIEERLEKRDLESITARFITKLLWPLLLQGKFPFAVSLRVVGISRKDGKPPWPLFRWLRWQMLYFIASDRSVIGSWSVNVDPGEDWFS